MSAVVTMPREVILASAGSGKTFRISSRIIGLLAAGEAPDTIFASTFTRKAAGEILDRVLIRLAKAALDESEARELAGHARIEGQDPPPPDPSFWRDVLARTVREIHRLDVATLDAFFVRAVGSFGHELGLPPRWGIADDPTADRIRSEALADVLKEIDDGAQIELVRGLAGGHARRSVHQALSREVDDVLRVHEAIAPGATGWSALRAAVDEQPADLDVRCEELAEQLAAAEVPLAGSGTPNGHWVRAVAAVVESVRGQAWEDVIGKGLVGKVLTDGDDATYYRSTFPPSLRRLMDDAAELARRCLAPKLAARAEAMGRLGELYGRAFEDRLRSTGMFRFEDMTRLLTGPASIPGRSDLFYRLDGRALHLLLDEFQDTSLPQWAALEPLADGLIGVAGGAACGAEGGKGAAVVVADPKQSIYGWRGAAPVVVRHAAERYDLERETLATSWRSSQVVLDAVNRVFDSLEDREFFDDHDIDRSVAAEWAEAFQPHTAQHDLPGYVRLVVGPRDAGRSSKRPELCRCAAEHIRAIAARAPGRSIGVLTRKNDTVARLMFELRELGVEASEEGGTPLNDAPAPATVLALLRMIDHPGDRLARYHVAGTPLGGVVGLRDPADDEAAAAVAARLRRQLVEDGYGATLAEIATAAQPSCGPRDRARLRQLVELGHRWDERPTLRVDDFVRFVEAERVQQPARADLRVMTVHQSKGLEFDVVVLPELDESYTGGGRGGGGPLAFRPEPTGPVTHVFPPMKQSLRRLFSHLPELEAAYAQKRAGEVRDALSTLYVAATRARYALHMIVAADGEKGLGSTRSHARLLREALASLEEPAVDGDVLYEGGDPDWHETAPSKREPVAMPPVAPEQIPLRTGERRRMLGRRKPSDVEGVERVDLRQVLGLSEDGSSAARERGSLVHAWLEELEWVEDGLPDDDRMRAIARRVAPVMDEARVTEERAWLRERLRAPEVREALGRAAYTEGATVERELPFLRREGDALVEGVIDRLVLVREGGRLVRAEVLDYKTNRIESGDTAELAAKVEHYTPQLLAYRRAVAGIYRLPLQSVSARLVFLTPGAVRAVEPAGE